MSKFTAYKSDLESVTGKYDTVTCIDVLIHYPEEKMQEMIRHLASISNERIIVSFAPKLWYYELLKKIGSYFPGLLECRHRASTATSDTLDFEEEYLNTWPRVCFTLGGCTLEADAFITTCVLVYFIVVWSRRDVWQNRSFVGTSLSQVPSCE